MASKKANILRSGWPQGGGAATSALTVSKCEKFDPFFFSNGIWLYDTQNASHLIVRDLKNAFLVPLTPLLYRYLTVLWQSSRGSKEELDILVVGWKWLSGVKSISEHIESWSEIKKNTPKKFSQKTDREVGVNAYGQPKISVFLTPSLKRYSEAKQ